MAEHSELFRAQYEFAAHIRDPDGRPRPRDVEERRMAIYRQLFYNNLESLLAGNFPVLRKLLSEEHWHAMVRDFFIRHRCETPLFLEISQELLDYLQNERTADPDDPPFLLELAHYEWVELALSVSDEEPNLAGVDPNGDLMSGRPAVSPLAWNLSYRYPVHKISPEYRPPQPPAEPTHLVVYRDRSDEVRFLEVNAVTQRLLQLLEENPDWTGHAAVAWIAEELQHPRPEVVISAGRQLLDDLRSRHIILGTRRKP
jgi:hypothetical protein